MIITIRHTGGGADYQKRRNFDAVINMRLAPPRMYLMISRYALQRATGQVDKVKGGAGPQCHLENSSETAEALPDLRDS